jgi:hypothetical protein
MPFWTPPSWLLRSREAKPETGHSKYDRSVGYLLRLMKRSVGHVSSPPLFIRQFQKGSSRKLGWGKKEQDEQTGSG